MALILGVQYGTPVTSTTYTGIPAGTIMPCGTSGVLTRTLLCDGTSYARNLYPALFAAIGTSFGSVDGNSFNVPDFRGRFLRGVDGSTGRDPDSGSRTAMNTGGNTGNAVGSVQGHAFQSHTHTVSAASVTSPGGLASGGSGSSITGNNTITSSAASGTTTTETRPVNAYINYCIAY